MCTHKMLSGFTLIEILLVIGLISALAGIVIIAIHPAQQFADARNTKRQVDVGIIASAIRQYSLDNHGAVPAGIPEGSSISDCTQFPQDDRFSICKTDAQSCSAITLAELINNNYIGKIPVDPTEDSDPANDPYSGYNVVRASDNGNRITVCAPNAENGGVIYTPQ